MSKPLAEALNPALEVLRRRASGEIKPYPLPWDTWNTALGGGLWPGLHGVIGPTGAGKTQAIVQIMEYGARMGYPTCYIGLEMSEVDLLARLISLRSDKPWSDYLTGQIEEQEFLADKEKHWSSLTELPIRAEFAPPNGWPYGNLLKEGRLMVEHHSPAIKAGHTPLIILDYLQLVDGAPGEQTKERISRASYMAQTVANKIGAAVICISSTSRSNYERLAGRSEEGGKPWLHDPNELVGMGKESGDLEYAATGLFVMAKDTSTKTIWIGPAKYRFGTPGWLAMNFNGIRMQEGLGQQKKVAFSLEQAETFARQNMEPGRVYTLSAFIQECGLGSGDAQTLRAKGLREGWLILDEKKLNSGNLILVEKK